VRPSSSIATGRREEIAAVVGCKSGRACYAALSSTIGAHNVDSWPRALAIAKDLDCPILFQPAVGSILDGNIALAPHSADVQRYREAFHGIIKAQQQGEPVANDWLCLDYLRRWPDPQPVPFCAGGRIQAAIDPDGNMFPCGCSGRTSSAPNVFRPLGVLYNNWLHGVATRFQKKFDDISAEFNFELGPEFEIAICKVLQDLLPRRFGVCRGFVVGQSGDLAGDTTLNLGYVGGV